MFSRGLRSLMTEPAVLTPVKLRPCSRLRSLMTDPSVRGLIKLRPCGVLRSPVRGLVKRPRGVVTSFMNLGRSNKEDGPPYTHFVQIGDPVLKMKCQPVEKEEIQSEGIQTLLTRMVYTLERYDGVGISAPQIGIPLQIFIIQFTRSQMSGWTEKIQKERNMEVVPLQIFINPTLSILDNSQISSREGCCSTHGYSCRVSRFKSVKLSALNEEGNPVEVTAKDWTARMIQHEMDHLNGYMITDKMDPGTLSMDYWNIVNRRQGEFKLSFEGIKAGPKKWFTSPLIWKRS